LLYEKEKTTLGIPEKSTLFKQNGKQRGFLPLLFLRTGNMASLA